MDQIKFRYGGLPYTREMTIGVYGNRHDILHARGSSELLVPEISESNTPLLAASVFCGWTAGGGDRAGRRPGIR